MIELTNELQAVREFHAAFGHPISTRPTALPLDRRLTRTCWILSELNEFALAVNLPDELDAAVGMSDALTDALYFVLGSAVEMGEPLFEFQSLVTLPDALTPKQVLGLMQRRLTAHLVETVRGHQLTGLFATAEILARYHAQLFGFSIDEVFPIVHAANMAKLWPDGTPRYRESDHKVMKPEGWIPPEARIRQYFISRQSAIINAA